MANLHHKLAFIESWKSTLVHIFSTDLEHFGVEFCIGLRLESEAERLWEMHPLLHHS